MSLPAFINLRRRPGPPLSKGQSWACVGCMGLVRSLRTIRRLPHTLLFLLSYFMYADGLGTVGAAAAILYTQQVAGMNSYFLGAAIACAYVTGVIGSLFFMWLQKRFRINGKWVCRLFVFSSRSRSTPLLQILFGCILGVAFIPLWAFFGLTTLPEAFGASALYGLFLGSIYAQGRACFARMIPRGMEAELWSLYATVDKGAAWLGPLVLLLVNQATCSFRIATFAVSGFFLLGALLLLPCDFHRAYNQAKEFRADHATGPHSYVPLDDLKESAKRWEAE